MSPWKKTSIFFLVCSLTYALLIIPWPGLFDGYRACFRAGGNVLFHSFGPGGSVRFEPLASGDHTKDTTLVMRKKGLIGKAELDMKAVYMGYRPTAFMIALVLATPIPWSRRWRALLWGFLWVNVFVAFRVWLKMLDAYSDNNALSIYEFSDLTKSVLDGVVAVLVSAPEAHYMIPVFIWVLVAFRRDTWRETFGLQPAPVGPNRGKKKPQKA
ncbi:MAG: hypothetical protein PVI86_02885 [Phycisphaerae bacterium]|jgi:hypothetical protein